MFNKRTVLARIFLNVIDRAFTSQSQPVPLQIPIGAEDNFEGVVDLVKMKGIYWDEASQGTKFEYRDVPANLLDQAKEWREKLVEVAAETSEELMDKYLNDGDLPEEDIKKALRQRTIAGEIVPMMCGSAFKNKGVQAMLDAVIEYLPSPVDIPAVEGTDENDNVVSRKASDDEKFAALAFKIMTDPFVGQLIFFRVYSGVVKSGDTVLNPIKNKKERIGRLLQMHGQSARRNQGSHGGRYCGGCWSERSHYRQKHCVIQVLRSRLKRWSFLNRLFLKLLNQRPSRIRKKWLWR